MTSVASEQDLPRITVVTGVIGVDAHVTGNWVVNHALVAEGIEVVGLGVCVPQIDFIRAAVETKADAIWITSLYGHAAIDCEGFRSRCKEAGIGDVLLYIGGMLVVGKNEWLETSKLFLEMGFDRVYPPNTLPESAIQDLKNDLQVNVSSGGQR